MTSVSQSYCEATNQACLCNDVHYTAVLQKCVVSSCTIQESLSELMVSSFIRLVITANIHKLQKMSQHQRAGSLSGTTQILFLMQGLEVEL